MELFVTGWSVAVETFASPTFFVIHRKTAVLEIALIVMWAIFVGRHYLDFDPHTIPAGREYGLTVQAPAGQHTYTFRYLPWDVLVGVLLFGIGCYLSAYLWWPIRKP